MYGFVREFSINGNRGAESRGEPRFIADASEIVSSRKHSFKRSVGHSIWNIRSGGHRF